MFGTAPKAGDITLNKIDMPPSLVENYNTVGSAEEQL